MTTRARRRAALAGTLELAWWWGVTTGIWLLTISAVTAADLAAAAACGVPCAVAARAGRRAVGDSWRPRPRWAGWLAWLPVTIAADTARLLAAAARGDGRGGQQGGFREVAIRPGEREPAASGSRAVAAILLSAAPGTLAADTDPEEGTLMVHDLASGWPHLDRAVSR